MTFPQNIWYQAGWADEIASGQMLARTVTGKPILFVRSEEGKLAALADACPHRFAPLSRGFLDGPVIRCGYHGLGFAHDGRCVSNPHGPISSSVRVLSYPIVEQDGAIWIWMGDAEADPSRIRDLSFIGEVPDTARVQGYMPTKANYQLLADNILDLSHTTYLHANSLGGLSPTTRMAVVEDEESVEVSWTDEGIEPNPIFKAAVPEETAVDTWVTVRWTAPALMTLDSGVVPTGTEPEWKDHTVTIHSMTPETESTTHYFYCFTRRIAIDDCDVTAMNRQIIERAFYAEDKPMIEAQQQRIGDADLFDLKPALLPIDNAAVRARRKLQKLGAVA